MTPLARCLVAAVTLLALLPVRATGTSSPHAVAAGAPVQAASGRDTAPDPAALLFLPPGSVRDDALENADATARNAANAPLVAASAFAGARTENSAMIQYVARLHRRADAAPFLAAETAAVGRTREADRLTPPARYGDSAMLAYQERGSRGQEWVMLLFAAGPYVTMLGVYDAAGEQAALDTLQRLAALMDTRLRDAARRAPDPPVLRPRPEQPLRLISLLTTTRQGRRDDLFRPHSAVYWRAVWRVGHIPKGARETLREVVWRGKSALYRNGLTDRPFSGDNGVVDHLQLRAAAIGAYNVTLTITIGRLSAHATHTFRVAAAHSKNS